MTRPCGCGGNAALTCNCLVVAGANMHVAGTGNPGNAIVLSSDMTTLAVADTGTIDHTLTGTPQAGYGLSSRLIISGQAQNALTTGADGGAYVPQGAQGALVTGCGLTGTGAAATPLKMATPQTVSGFSASGATVSYTSAQLCAGVSVTEATKVTIANPSACQPMIVDVQAGGRIRLAAADAFNTAWAVTMGFTLIRDGADAGLIQAVTVGRPIAAAEYYHDEHYALAPITLAPGASTTLGYRMDSTISGQCQINSAAYNSPAIKAIGHMV